MEDLPRPKLPVLQIAQSDPVARNIAGTTACFDILSPAPGDNEVISHVDRLIPRDENRAKTVTDSVRGLGIGQLRIAWSSPECVVATSLCKSTGRYPPHGIFNEVHFRTHAKIAPRTSQKPLRFANQQKRDL